MEILASDAKKVSLAEALSSCGLQPSLLMNECLVKSRTAEAHVDSTHVRENIQCGKFRNLGIFGFLASVTKSNHLPPCGLLGYCAFLAGGSPITLGTGMILTPS